MKIWEDIKESQNIMKMIEGYGKLLWRTSSKD